MNPDLWSVQVAASVAIRCHDQLGYKILADNLGKLMEEGPCA